MRATDLIEAVHARFDGKVPMVGDKANLLRIVLTVLEILRDEGFLILEVEDD